MILLRTEAGVALCVLGLIGSLAGLALAVELRSLLGFFAALLGVLVFATALIAVENQA